MRVIRFAALLRFLILYLLMGMILTSCVAAGTTDSSKPILTPSVSPGESASASACPVTEPLWIKPPQDSAVEGPPAYGYYFVNEDRSIWASAWWTKNEEYPLSVSEEGVKVGWFRPAGSTLEITGQRIDAQAPTLETHIPCCYPTRFQATGLVFPTQGCWEITAKAEGRLLSFIVEVYP